MLCPKQIKNISGCSVSSFKYYLNNFFNTIPNIPCVANYANSLDTFFHTNIHLLMVWTPCDLIP